jgi:hypothetical protein
MLLKNGQCIKAGQSTVGQFQTLDSQENTFLIQTILEMVSTKKEDLV